MDSKGETILVIDPIAVIGRHILRLSYPNDISVLGTLVQPMYAHLLESHSLRTPAIME